MLRTGHRFSHATMRCGDMCTVGAADGPFAAYARRMHAKRVLAMRNGRLVHYASSATQPPDEGSDAESWWLLGAGAHGRAPQSALAVFAQAVDAGETLMPSLFEQASRPQEVHPGNSPDESHTAATSILSGSSETQHTPGDVGVEEAELPVDSCIMHDSEAIDSGVSNLLPANATARLWHAQHAQHDVLNNAAPSTRVVVEAGAEMVASDATDVSALTLLTEHGAYGRSTQHTAGTTEYSTLAPAPDVGLSATDALFTDRSVRLLLWQLNSFTSVDRFLGRFEMLGAEERRRGGALCAAPR